MSRRYRLLAERQARRNPENRWRLFAVLSRPKPIAVAFNDTSRRRHAEMRALSQVSDASGAILQVARVRRDGQLGLAKPCSNCEERIRAAGVRTVEYTTTDGWERMTL